MDFLNSIDERDLVQRPDLWTDEKVSSIKLSCPFADRIVFNSHTEVPSAANIFACTCGVPTSSTAEKPNSQP